MTLATKDQPTIVIEIYLQYTITQSIKRGFIRFEEFNQENGFFFERTINNTMAAIEKAIEPLENL